MSVTRFPEVVPRSLPGGRRSKPRRLPTCAFRGCARLVAAAAEEGDAMPTTTTMTAPPVEPGPLGPGPGPLDPDVPPPPEPEPAPGGPVDPGDPLHPDPPLR